MRGSHKAPVELLTPLSAVSFSFSCICRLCASLSLSLSLSHSLSALPLAAGAHNLAVSGIVTDALNQWVITGGLDKTVKVRVPFTLSLASSFLPFFVCQTPLSVSVTSGFLDSRFSVYAVLGFFYSRTQAHCLPPRSGPPSPSKPGKWPSRCRL